MLRLVYVHWGATGVLRCYQHPKLGMIETVTTWRDPGAHIIHIETERDRQAWRAMGDELLQRASARKGRSPSTRKKACNRT